MLLLNRDFFSGAKIVLFIVLRDNELSKKGKKEPIKRIINNILRFYIIV